MKAETYSEEDNLLLQQWMMPSSLSHYFRRFTPYFLPVGSEHLQHV